MVLRVDATKPADDVAVDKVDLRANFAAVDLPNLPTTVVLDPELDKFLLFDASEGVDGEHRGVLAKDVAASLLDMAIDVNASQVDFDNAGTGLEAVQVQAALVELDAAIAAIEVGDAELPVIDNTAIVHGSSDATKRLRFEVDGFTTSTTRVITPADRNWSPTVYGEQLTEAANAGAARAHLDAPSNADLAGKADTGHVHSAADLTSGTLPNARVSAGNVTQHQGAIDHNALANFSAVRHVDHSAVSVSGQHSIAGGGDISANRTLALVNDEATPGNDKVYGTDGSGVKGWKDDPAGGAGTVTAQHSVEGDGSVGDPLQLVGDTATPGNSKVYGTDGAGARGWQDATAGGDMTKAVYDPTTVEGDAFDRTKHHGQIVASTDIDASGTPGPTTFLRGDDVWAAPAGGGDMAAAVYDPTAVEGDAFDRANHHGTQTLATISDAGDLAAHTAGAQQGISDANATYSRATHGDHAAFLFQDLTANRTLTLNAAEGVKGGTVWVRVRNSSGFLVTVRAEDPNDLGTFSDLPVHNDWFGIWRKDNDGTSWWTEQPRAARAAERNPPAVSQSEAEEGTETAVRGWSPLRVHQAAVQVLPPDVSTEEAEEGTVTSVRLWSPLRVSQAIAALAEGSVPGPATYEITTAHLLSFSSPDNRAHRNRLGVVTAAAAITVPKTAGPGSVWVLDVATAGAVTVAVEDNAGSINGTAGGTITAAGEGAALTVWVRDNSGSAPEVVVKGDTTEAVLVSGAFDFNGNLVGGNLVVTGTASGTLANTDAGKTLRTTGNITIPQTAGFNLTIIAGGAHTITFGAGTSPALATGDMVSLVVDDQVNIHAAPIASADKLAFT